MDSNRRERLCGCRSSIDEMLKANFIKIGKTFPAFLHPHTKEEYALARTEKKTGKRHTDFVCDFSPSVTLEEDLFRRDLTINAIVINDCDIVDPFNGQKDIEARQLRHISNAFAKISHLASGPIFSSTQRLRILCAPRNA